MLENTIRCAVMRSDGEFVFWLTPGGEIEAGEEPAAAAVREVREELGLELAVTPAYTEANQFEHQGEMRDNVDYVFTARCGAGEPLLRGVTAEEIALMQEARWWPVQELRGPHEPVFPVDIVKVAEAAWERVSAGNQAG